MGDGLNVHVGECVARLVELCEVCVNACEWLICGAMMKSCMWVGNLRGRHGKEECLVLEMHVNACECMCV